MKKTCKGLMNFLESKGCTNFTIIDMFTKAYSVLNNPKYKNIMVSISGGVDSDVMLDVCSKVTSKPIQYVWFDTGIEYTATKEHLVYLEDKYNIHIISEKAEIPVPLGVKKFGLPFKSKKISDFLSRLIKHNFKFQDLPFEQLILEYPNCRSTLRWWCNCYEHLPLNINYTRGLKEFLIKNPPKFAISDKCCKGAKKDVSKRYLKLHNIELSIIGVRRSEGGVRSIAYKDCFSYGDSVDNYRPLFWLSDSDKKEYEELFDIKHSKCYSEYGLKRTGCCGCPFGRDFEKELGVLEKFEPRLFNAVNSIFKESYDYTRKFLESR